MIKWVVNKKLSTTAHSTPITKFDYGSFNLYFRRMWKTEWRRVNREIDVLYYISRVDAIWVYKVILIGNEFPGAHGSLGKLPQRRDVIRHIEQNKEYQREGRPG